MSKNIETEKKWIITFSNGYCSCDIKEEFVGTFFEAIDFAREYLPDYAEQYAHAEFGWGEEYTEEEYEEYFENCDYEIEESEEEE